MEEDESVPDKESDIKPRFHRSKTHNVNNKTEGEEVWIVAAGIVRGNSGVGIVSSGRIGVNVLVTRTHCYSSADLKQCLCYLYSYSMNIRT